MAAPVARVRAARSSDEPAVDGLYRHYVRHSSATVGIASLDPEVRHAGWRDPARGGPHRLLLAESEPGALLGWAASGPFRPRAAYVTMVETSVDTSAYCHPDSLGQQVGPRRYGALFAELADEAIERVVADVTLPNPASMALHERFGFRRVGVFTRVGRKFDRFWDVAWLERPLRLGADPDG